MADVLKTVLFLAIFLVLVVANIRNIMRHRKEKQDAKRKKEIGGFTVMKQMKPEEEQTKPEEEQNTGDGS